MIYVTISVWGFALFSRSFNVGASLPVLSWHEAYAFVVLALTTGALPASDVASGVKSAVATSMPVVHPALTVESLSASTSDATSGIAKAGFRSGGLFNPGADACDASGSASPPVFRASSDVSS